MWQRVRFLIGGKSFQDKEPKLVTWAPLSRRASCVCDHDFPVSFRASSMFAVTGVRPWQLPGYLHMCCFGNPLHILVAEPVTQRSSCHSLVADARVECVTLDKGTVRLRLLSFACMFTCDWWINAALLAWWMLGVCATC